MTDRTRTARQTVVLLEMSAVIENAPYWIEDTSNRGRDVAPDGTLGSSGSSGSSGHSRSACTGRSADTQATQR